MSTGATRRSNGGRPFHGAHWTVFLPTVVVFLLYGGVWLVLICVGKGNTALAKISLLVILIVVPVLAIHAYLRLVSLGLMFGRDFIVYRQGWLRPRWKRLRIEDLSHASVVQGPVARWFGGGGVILSKTDGSDVCLYDLADPGTVARRITNHIGKSGS